MDHALTDALDDVPQRLEGFADALQAEGRLTDPAWREALYAAPRHLFIPDRAWIFDGIEPIELNRVRDPGPWWDAVYDARTVIVTQFNDSDTGPDDSGPIRPSSSCPDPRVQLKFLEALDLDDGMRVLEIGTGTGWNAALLAHRLGDRQVVSVEVDRLVLGRARQALARSGQNPLTVEGDGRHGYPAGAPYDRVVATCAVHTVPHHWVTQSRPGGIILAPWRPRARQGGDFLARLQVAGDGTATGPFVDNMSFMWLRQHRRPDDLPRPDVSGPSPEGMTSSTTTVNPFQLLFRTEEMSLLAQANLGPGRCGISKERDSGNGIVWLSDHTRSSWARVRMPVPIHDPTPAGTRFVVEQYGPRRLWDETEAIHDWWQAAGRPDHLRFGLTVRADGQTVWLDEPSHPVFELPADAPPAFVGSAAAGPG